MSGPESYGQSLNYRYRGLDPNHADDNSHRTPARTKQAKRAQQTPAKVVGGLKEQYKKHAHIKKPAADENVNTEAPQGEDGIVAFGGLPDEQESEWHAPSKVTTVRIRDQVDEFVAPSFSGRRMRPLSPSNLGSHQALRADLWQAQHVGCVALRLWSLLFRSDHPSSGCVSVQYPPDFA